MPLKEALERVIIKHFGTATFPPADTPDLSGFWAQTVIDANENSTLTFGESSDADAVAGLRHDVLCVLRGLDALSLSTLNFTPRTRTKEVIAGILLGKEPGAIYRDTSVALHALLGWLNDLAKEPAFRRQAKGGRNWRAASVAVACRNLWGFGQWHIQGHPDPHSRLRLAKSDLELAEAQRLASAKVTFVMNCAPRSEKYDAPGPFGRFLEEVFEVLEIRGRDGSIVSAHSALRALSQAVSRNPEEL
jgi:hypothetical protein